MKFAASARWYVCVTTDEISAAAYASHFAISAGLHVASALDLQCAAANASPEALPRPACVEV